MQELAVKNRLDYLAYTSIYKHYDIKISPYFLEELNDESQNSGIVLEDFAKPIEISDSLDSLVAEQYTLLWLEDKYLQSYSWISYLLLSVPLSIIKLTLKTRF